MEERENKKKICKSPIILTHLDNSLELSQVQEDYLEALATMPLWICFSTFPNLISSLLDGVTSETLANKLTE